MCIGHGQNTFFEKLNRNECHGCNGTARLQIKGIADTRTFIGFSSHHIFLNVLKNRLRDARLTTSAFGLKSVYGLRTFFFRTRQTDIETFSGVRQENIEINVVKKRFTNVGEWEFVRNTNRVQTRV